jgi:hypothetical protein
LFDARVTTVILLAEKESNETNRANNNVLIARIPTNDTKKVTETLKCIGRSLDEHYEFDGSKLKECQGLWFKFINQSEIQTDDKWITLFFNERAIEELERLVKEGKMIRLGDWFEPSRGNTVSHCLSNWGMIEGRGSCGAKQFFRFNESKKTNGIQTSKGIIKVPEECLYPAILDAMSIKTFIFKEEDWKNLRDKGKYTYLFICHKPRDEQIKDYLEWGENECRNRSGRPCSESISAKGREREKSLFYGWYDLGGILLTPLIAKYTTQYYPHFFISKYPAVTNDNFVTFIPKVSIEGYNVDQLKSVLVKLQNKQKKIMVILDDIEKNSKITLSTKELKALTAYLNSTLVWNWLEFRGRAVSGGPLEIDLNVVRDIPIPNLKRLNEKDVDELAKLFDELEAEARKQKERKVLETLNYLKPIKQEIDRKICEIYDLKIDVEELWNSTVEMMERRRGVDKSRKKLDLGSENEIVRKKERKGKTVSLESFIYED